MGVTDLSYLLSRGEENGCSRLFRSIYFQFPYLYVESQYAMTILFGFAIQLDLLILDVFAIKESWGIQSSLDFDEIGSDIDSKKDLAKFTMFTSVKNFVTNKDCLCYKNASKLSNAMCRLA